MILPLTGVGWAMLWLWTALALAAPPETTERDVAEATRLSHEIERLAERNAWMGVERMFADLLETGVAPGFDEWVAGAHAARSRGDLAAARTRLDMANRLQEDRQVVEWLFDVDARFGRVWLACDKALDATVVAHSPSFQPESAAAVAFAADRLSQDCSFDGLLPAGHYRFTWGSHEETFEVVPRVQSVRIDLRGMDPKLARKSRRSEEPPPPP